MRPRVVLGALLVVGAGLRFYGLSAGLRHIPHVDERYFVENVGWMLARGDLDHRFQEYPGLFFYLLAPVLAFFSPPSFGASGYLAARAVVAAFSVFSLLLVYLLGVRIAGSRAGLLAAALLAVSPVEVYTAHEVRPDVVLESFVLLAFLTFQGIGASARADAVSGLALGAATAVKFSGVLLAPSYLASRLLAPGARLRGIALAVGASLLAFAVLSPYSLLHFGALGQGIQTQVSYHYVPRGEGGYGVMVWTYLRVLAKALGPAALGLVAVGILRARTSWRRWLPVLMLPVVTIAVFATAEVHHDRFLVPTLGMVALLAGLGVEELPSLAALFLAVGAVVPPLVDSGRYLTALSAPSTRDLALDWILAHEREGARILTTVEDLGLDRATYEVLIAERLDSLRARQGSHMDVVVARAREAGRGGEWLRIVQEFRPAFPESGFPIEIAVPAGPPSYEVLALEDRWLRASERQELLGRLHDGDPATAWSTEGNQKSGDFVEVDWPVPRRLGKIEMVLGKYPRQFPRNLHVLVREGGGAWRRVPVAQGRPPVDAQVPAAGLPSDVLIFEPVLTRGVRILQVGQRARPWAIAEMKIYALPDPQ